MLRRLVEMLRGRQAPPEDERSTKAIQLEGLRDAVGATLDRVDRIAPPQHDRFASYRRVRVGR